MTDWTEPQYCPKCENPTSLCLCSYQPEARPEQDTQCETCGKPKFGPWTTVCSADIGKTQDYYCQCAKTMSVQSEVMSTGQVRQNNSTSNRETTAAEGEHRASVKTSAAQPAAEPSGAREPYSRDKVKTLEHEIVDARNNRFEGYDFGKESDSSDNWMYWKKRAKSAEAALAQVREERDRLRELLRRVKQPHTAIRGNPHLPHECDRCLADEQSGALLSEKETRA